MRIQVLEVGGVEVRKSKDGKSYRAFELQFVSEGRSGKKMLFATSGVGKTLVEAQVGSLWDINTEQSGEYTNWTGVTSAGQATPVEKKAAAATKSTYETPEERAKKQVYIVRQSSIASAIAFHGANAADPLTTEDIIETAKKFEAYVFDTQPDSEVSVD